MIYFYEGGEIKSNLITFVIPMQSKLKITELKFERKISGVVESGILKS